MKKILLPLSLLIFGLISCEKETTIEDDLQGIWYMPQILNRSTSGRSVNDLADHSLNAWNYSMVVTTNSNQKLIDRMADSEGAISISGIVNDEIKFMVPKRRQSLEVIEVYNEIWLNNVLRNVPELRKKRQSLFFAEPVGIN